MAAVTVSVVCGCTSLPDPDAPQHDKITLGMPLADVQRKLGQDGEVREERALPVSPKPRQAYPKLPPQVEWRRWMPTATGKKKPPSILLGFADGKVIYKQVIQSGGGKIKTETTVGPEYQ